MRIDSKKDNKYIYIFSFLSLTISALCISISFLIMSSNLKLEDYKGLQSAGWNIKFTNLSDAALEGSAGELNLPYIDNNSTSIKNFSVLFHQHNDSATYSFTVENNGILDARISSITETTPICRGTGEDALEDAKMVCENLEVSLEYDNGEKVRPGDILDSKKSNNLKVIIKYKSKTLPRDTVEIENIAMTIIYVQK